MLTQFLIFIIVISILVFVHELAHFVTAKRAGVKVEEFGFGLPPRVFGKKFGGTVYSINLLPIGGFVRLKGEDAEIFGLGDSHSFADKSPLRRAIIIISGVLGNFVFAVLLFSLLFGVGMPVFSDKVHVSKVETGSSAEAAGVQRGDFILKANGKDLVFADDLVEALREKEGQEVILEIERGREVFEVTAIPDPIIGVVVSNVIFETYPWWQAPYRATIESGKITWMMVVGVGGMFKNLLVRGEVPKDVAGPVGVFKLTEFYTSLGLRYLLQFMGILSLNFALINILPFPALDGGRLMFVVIEVITGRRVPAKLEKLMHQAGFVLLLLLMILVTFQDFSTFLR